MRILTYKKILFTHDGSKVADIAIPHAATLAKVFKSEIIVLQVAETFWLYHPLSTPKRPITLREEALKHMVENEIAAAKANVSTIKKLLQKEGIAKIKTEIKDGIPIEEIIRYVKDQNIDIIVMATHGRSGLKRVLLGSVADNVIRNVSCPVLLINVKNKL